MKKILMILFISLSFSCADDKPESGELTDFLPPNPAVILQMNNPDLFFSNFQNNEFIKQNLEHEVSQKISGKLGVLRHFPLKNKALLAFVADGERIDFSFITRGALSPISLDSIPNKQVETLTSKDLKILKYVLEGKSAFTTQIDSITIISSSKNLLENSIFGTHSNSQQLETAFKAASPKKPNIFIDHSKAPAVFGNIFPEFLRNFSQWTVVDAELSQTQINLDGISIAADTLSQHLQFFQNVGVSQNRLGEISPVTSHGFTSISFRSFDELERNLHNSSQNDLSSEVSLLKNASEAGIIELPEGKIFAVRSLDPEAARQMMVMDLQKKETYRETDIFEYAGSSVFGELLKPLLLPEALQVMAFLDTWVLFADNTEALHQLIATSQNGLVLGNTEAYKSSAESLSSEASFLVVKNHQALPKGEASNNDLDYSDFPISALQFIQQDNFAHVHAVLKKNSALKTEKATAQAAAVDLGAALAGKPVFFQNHRTKGMDIAVQDVENTLYLISPEGKIYWKKKLNSRILGEVHTVDIFRNGRYQLAFATQSELHIIDRDGNPVRPFPLKFRDAITQPLSVFDYDNKRDYRFVVTQGNDLLMYDRKGKAVRGFRFSKAGSEIIQPPKHVRIGRKDYILVPESSGKLHILSRTGKTRVPVREEIEFSENDWYEYNDNFVSTNTSGQVLKVNENGSVKRENVDFAGNTRITATPKTLVSLSENELSIGKSSATLDFGLYTEPQIFYINNKIYVSVTDLQAHKVYLFDSNTNLLPGFPVYGNSLVDLSNANDDTALELVVQGEENGVLIYSVSSAQ
ncbi:MAG: hypothetical protein R3259_05440 [Salinimicrobium sediminis]|nr:hypothetical protein [Salinimicrobium sediminis]